MYASERETDVVYGDYVRSDMSSVRLRHISGSEYAACPKKNKSKVSLFFGKAGIAFIVGLIFALAGWKYCADLFIAGDPDKWESLLIFGFVGLFVSVIPLGAVLLDLDKLVTRESLVVAGEIIDAKVTRGYRSGTTAIYTIALHAGREIVTVKDTQTITPGSTVLIIKSHGGKFFMMPIPRDAADLVTAPPDHSIEIQSAGRFTADDLRDYRKMAVGAVEKHFLTKYELMEVPVKYRACRPLSRGLVTVCWLIFPAISAVMLGFIVHYTKTRNVEVAFPLIGGFLCEMILEWVLTTAAFERPLKGGRSYCVECVIINRTKLSGRGFVSIVLPKTKQFADNAEVDPALYDTLPMNVPVKMYFDMKSGVAKYVCPI